MVYQFDQFEVDDREFRLSEDGTPVQVEPKVLRLLVYLIENRNRLVRKQELLDQVWPDAMVTENALTRAVGLLRKALSENSQVPRYIETVPTAGYRFIANVSVVTATDLSHEPGWVEPGRIAETGSEAGVPAPVAAKRRSAERMWQLTAGVAAVLLLASAAWIAIHLRNEPAPPAMVQFQIPAPDKLNFYSNQLPAVSPDGQRIAFAASSNPFNINFRLFVRPLNAATATEILIPGSSAGFPFWSPDSQQIAFTSNGILQRVDLSGAPPVTICSDCNAALGGTWNRDGVILITSVTTKTLIRISVAGGEAKPLRPRATGESGQIWPEFLPDGRHYLYLSTGKAPYQQGIYAASLDSDDRTFIVATNANASWLPSGQLLFMRGNALMAQPFDIRSLKLSGEPHAVADHIESGATRSTLPIATFAASPSGVLLWRHDNRTALSSLQWFDRNGKGLGIVGEPADYSNPALSPDSSKLAVSIRDPQTKTRDIWIFDLVRGGKTRLTFDPADDLDCVWSPDGTRIAFTSDRAGQRNIYWKLADGSGPEELLLGGKDGAQNVEGWSWDGKYLLYGYDPDRTPQQLYVMPLTGDRKPVPFIKTQFPTQQGSFSPDDRWVAYRSPESGTQEVYVQGFSLDSSQPRGKWQVSTAGGELPRWRGDGKELFYHFSDSFFAVDVKTDGPAFAAGIPKRLFDIPAVSASATHGEFTVTTDGQRFLVTTASDKATAQPIEVVVNWR
jgi:Tol biopolymer transport system component/DNA-binding winged helix-turn-helix (wHTH) protein